MVEFLGYIIKPTGVEMDPEKVQTVKQWPMLESIHDIQRFLGFANFYWQFIAHFAQIAKPLTSLVKLTECFKKFELPEDAQQAFHKLIQAFMTAGVLRHFNYHLPTRTAESASYSHRSQGAQVLQVTALHHRMTSKMGGDKGSEPDALTRQVDMQPVSKEQEHNVWQLLPAWVFKKVENEIGKRSRIQQNPAETIVVSTILQISTELALAVCLDDDSVLVAPMLTMESIAMQELKELTNIFQPLDQELQEIHVKKLFEVKDGLWHSGGRLVILKFMVMSQCHDGITARHVGQDATIKVAQWHYWWPNMTAWIADYVASCPIPWGSILLDFIEGLPLSRGYDSILVIVDRLTKYAILAPTHKTVMAKQTAMSIWGHVVKHFGFPDHMVSNWGRQFISNAWKEFAESMGVKHLLSMAYHPQTDGQTERVNQVVEQYLQMYCNYEQDDWANLLQTAAFVYNNTVHNSIGILPFFTCYRWNPKAHPDIPQQLGVNNPDCSKYLVDSKEHCKYLQDQIREAQH
ncbi:uncharacterized protein UHO2_00453 [Ustilago hordei]|uniref:uncharacterized protein n=1 Tax=Ustilago hordei TaxID=120017 RepID=UPI001A50CE4D|nr:uncharacterized protein UHO2_00453 [Ustilago hordei]SYW81968.1 related to gag-pol protein [Ustilago hordei]